MHLPQVKLTPRSEVIQMAAQEVHFGSTIFGRSSQQLWQQDAVRDLQGSS